ncbi:MAG: alpha-D-glucose phosphate-specific phosphoglucomutase [Gammaproteobacteria bacterium]|nr:alpha-D-glucose phosphate-specific phosphoglucomutase [Gammaproteobacteria bacterium]
MSVKIEKVPTPVFAGQRPGTSGLRKKVSEFQQPGFLENYIQSIFNVVGPCQGKSLVIGGDGRYYNLEATRTIIRMAVANGYTRLIVGCGGILSTPAASHLVRLHGASGAIILSASHNPGGPDGDFGIKYNGGNGAQVVSSISDKFYHQSLEITEYLIADFDYPDINQTGETSVGDCRIEIVDPVTDYATLMESFFDFDAIGQLLSRPSFRMCFDAMHAVNGPYAHEILEKRLGAPLGTVINGTPLTDFGGLHPDPNPVHAATLCQLMNGDDPPDFGAASDGDGDRNMVLATGLSINPCDSLAIMLSYAATVPGFKNNIGGVARSMPTSRAVDRVARGLDIPCYEVPTGWKNFGNLLDAGLICLCGEESYGTGSIHVREKDGLWAVLYWLDLIARLGQPPNAILRSHWQRYGRDYFTRHDYSDLSTAQGEAVYTGVDAQIAKLSGRQFAGLTVTQADNFAYRDPVDNSSSLNQGIRIFFEDQGRIVMRLSGTGTSGATIRLYFDRYQDAPSLLHLDEQKELAPLIRAAAEITRMTELTGREKPDIII